MSTSDIVHKPERLPVTEVRVGDFIEDHEDYGEVVEVSRFTPNLVTIRITQDQRPDEFLHCHEAYEVDVYR